MRGGEGWDGRGGVKECFCMDIPYNWTVSEGEGMGGEE